MIKLTQKQENFTLDVFSDVTPSKAYLNHYKCKPSASYALASRLLTYAKIQARLKELNTKLEDAAISTKKERRKILTEIQRARFADFVDEFGNLSLVDKEQLRNAAVQEIKTERTSAGGIRTTLKLRDPVGAITEHNKMDRVYTEATPSTQDNRQYNFFIVGGESAKENLKLLTEGELLRDE